MMMARAIRLVVSIICVAVIGSLALRADAREERREVHYLSSGEDPRDYVKDKINTHDVMVFARSYGPHNAEAKNLLKEIQKEINIHVEIVEVDLLPGFDPSLIMHELQEVTGQWAFPNIFIGKKHIGGNSELDQLAALGELHDMLRELSSKDL
eukprot:CAMPEP_0119559546 /NCGR_PEP_ID=MMETSP1352-20130426/12889_1 /TAXON_ID=265584 /ORGANISM="Stauroneis constricta, Strain CCMP1120" /LENGTH=152 /DNA_ID=CAMNT_0007607287 /DNA_START=172 /DNA_END=630 /DNA_ORIENTATION=+